MLRDQNGDDDEDYQHEEQERASDAAAPWREVPRVIGTNEIGTTARSWNNRWRSCSVRSWC
jgi:hypothetical protein